MPGRSARNWIIANWVVFFGMYFSFFFHKVRRHNRMIARKKQPRSSIRAFDSRVRNEIDIIASSSIFDGTKDMSRAARWNFECSRVDRDISGTKHYFVQYFCVPDQNFGNFELFRSISVCHFGTLQHDVFFII